MNGNPPAERLFLLFSAVNESNIEESLGKPEYSYYFVLKGFASVLRELGEVRIVCEPAHEVDPTYDAAQSQGRACLFFCFAPPNKAVLSLRCPTIVVFAWEFDTIPQASLGMKGREDWASALETAGRAIALSTHSKAVVEKNLGNACKVTAIPVPVPILGKDRLQAANPKKDADQDLVVNGIVIDTAAYEIQAERILPLQPAKAFPLPGWPGEPIELSFRRDASPPASLCGFYEPEVWGAWSCLSEAWVLLPNMVSGTISLELTFMAYRSNIGKAITVSIGNDQKRLSIEPDVNHQQVLFSVDEPANLLLFSDLDAISYPDAPDPRSMAIGLMKARLRRPTATEQETASVSTKPSPQTLRIGGVLYTSVLNPKCGRKNWRDMLTAFCYTFRENANTTLLVKVSSQHHSDYFSELHELIAQLQPFRCRLVVLHGYLASETYRELVSMTDFYVNTSRAEGLCLPLMEFMASGKPAITPYHTALLDYVSADANVLVNSSEELTVWPHDPNEKYTATRRRIDWESLRSAFQESYEIVTRDPARYAQMATFARQRIKEFASRDRVKEKLDLLVSDTGLFAENQRVRYRAC